MSNCEITDFLKYKKDVYYKENPTSDFREIAKKQIIVCKKFIVIFGSDLAIFLCHIVQNLHIGLRYDFDWFVRTEDDLIEEMPFFSSPVLFSMFSNARDRKLLDFDFKAQENHKLIYRFMFTDVFKELIVEVFD